MNKIFTGAILAIVVLAVSASSVSAAALTRQLELGMSGTDVSTLQAFLGTDATIYPQNLITGYFGGLTKVAVSNFQVRNGIASVGRVGPVTLLAIKNQMAGITSGVDIDAPIITGANVIVSRNNATFSWNTNEMAKGLVYYSTSPLTLGEHETYVDVSGMTAMTDSNNRTSQNVYIPNLQAGTTYYYLAYSTDPTGNVTITWPASFTTTN